MRGGEPSNLDQVVPLVEATRGGIVESVHVGALAVVDLPGRRVRALGDPSLRTFPRSSLKPLQLLALVERGGVERFAFTPAELAVMAASHGGEEVHLDLVSSVLRKVGAPPQALGCGAHAPLDAGAAERLRSAGLEPSALHNNCSGKHASMLALARLLGAPLEGYLEPDHPAQRAIREALTDLLARGPDPLPGGVDGCGAPVYAVSLHAMALAFAWLGAASLAPARWAAPLVTVASAMRAHPEVVGGTSGRVDTDLMRLGVGLVAKGGAEGYFAVGQSAGRGLALKVLDGDPGRRAVRVAVVAALRALGWVDEAQLAGPLGAYGPVVPVTSWAGRPVGELQPARWAWQTHTHPADPPSAGSVDAGEQPSVDHDVDAGEVARLV